MDNFSFDDSVIRISDGRIDEITFDNFSAFITVTYDDCISCRRRNRQTVRLVVGRNTRIFNENGTAIPVTVLETGMIIDAIISSAMTRSIPPQASAFVIRIVSRPAENNITTGRIVNVNQQNRSFTTITDRNVSSVIQFNVPPNTPIFNRAGRPVTFSRLVPGLQVRVRHASFMTASIPPQTTAFEIRIL